MIEIDGFVFEIGIPLRATITPIPSNTERMVRRIADVLIQVYQIGTSLQPI